MKISGSCRLERSSNIISGHSKVFSFQFNRNAADRCGRRKGEKKQVDSLHFLSFSLLGRGWQHVEHPLIFHRISRFVACPPIRDGVLCWQHKKEAAGEKNALAASCSALFLSADSPLSL